MQSVGFRTDLDVRVEELALRLEPPLRPLARVAYNYWWGWAPDGQAVFAAVDPHRWLLTGANPVRFLNGLPHHRQLAAVEDHDLLQRIERLAAGLEEELARPARDVALDGPVAFLCSEFGVHASLPIYSGGLGVLAGDLLKEASDRAVPFVGVGLFYRYGYLSQRLDLSGRQQEFWLPNDPAQLPLALVHGDDGEPLLLEVPLFGRTLTVQVWRVEVGRVPLLLLDAERPENDAVQRWTTGRLYDGNESTRLAQYGLLGIGAARALEALGVRPAIVHLNEGHPALAALELQAQPDDVVFTTHTPLEAGNETYPAELFERAFGGLNLDGTLLSLAAAKEGRAGMSQLAMRLSARHNAVSAMHEKTAQGIWEPDFPGVQIGHVTNGAHVATWVGEPMRQLFLDHIGDGWLREPSVQASWDGVREIPSGDLWRARCEARARLVAYARAKAEQDRLVRGETPEYAEAVGKLDPNALTLGFARRLASYKRLSLVVSDADRLNTILSGECPAQLLIAGKAHPRDNDGKALLQDVYGHRLDYGRLVFLENYDLSVAAELVSGCDVWINVPRPPMEASGTSGMKATFNGVLQLSVLDGWWAEGYNGDNGWAVDDDGDDATAAESLYTLLEEAVVPMFYERDGDGIPQRWCERVKEALVTCAARFSATRMVDDYVARMYAPPRG